MQRICKVDRTSDWCRFSALSQKGQIFSIQLYVLAVSGNKRPFHADKQGGRQTTDGEKSDCNGSPKMSLAIQSHSLSFFHTHTHTHLLIFMHAMGWCYRDEAVREWGRGTPEWRIWLRSWGISLKFTTPFWLYKPPNSADRVDMPRWARHKVRPKH